MRRNSRNVFYFTHLLVDHLLVVVVFCTAIWLHHIHPFPELTLRDGGILLFLLTGWHFSSGAYALYVDRSDARLLRDIFRSINCIIVQCLLLVLILFALQDRHYPRAFVLTYTLSLAVVIPLAKIVLRKLFMHFFRRGHLCKRAVVIGDGESGRNFFQYMKDNSHYGYEMVRYIKGQVLQRTRGNYSAALNRIAIGETSLGRVDEVFISESEQALFDTRHLAAMLGQYAVRLRIIPHLMEPISHQPPHVGRLGDFALVSLRHEPLEDIYNRTAKRLFDIVFSLTVIVTICSWLVPLIALCIKLESKGPVFFKQECWGRRNRRFMCYRFRSMYVGARDTDATGKFQQARKNDSRITKVGAVLRRTSLDEFPQFFNVLFGDMSVVGPRPHASQMNIESIDVVNKYLVRHTAKPGVTGWAQVNGLRGESSDIRLLEARVAHDIWYIEHWSFLLDLKIIFLTFWNMVIGDKQAY